MLTSVVIICCMVARMHGKAWTAEGRLLDSLLANYNKLVRPVREPNTSLAVQISFNMGRIESLDSKMQILTSFGWLTAVWRDDLLTWSPDDYENTTELLLPANTVWLPEISKFNSVDHGGDDMDIVNNFRVRISYDGYITWSPAMRWRTTCPIELTYFPFDHHTCNVTFVNWMYTARLLHYTLLPGVGADVALDAYVPNGEWALISAEAVISNITLNDVVLTMASLQLHINRLAQYYLLNVLLPINLLTIMSLFVYLLPAESGEKITLSATVLLSYILFLLVISDISPRTSVSLPRISVFIIMCMGFTASSVLFSILVLNIHHHSPSRPVPRWMRTFAFRHLSRALLMGRLDAHEYIVQEPKPQRNEPATREQLNATDWKNLARVLDRFMLVVFVILIFALSAHTGLSTIYKMRRVYNVDTSM